MMLLHWQHKYIRAFLQTLLLLLTFISCARDDMAADATSNVSDETLHYLSIHFDVGTSSRSNRAPVDANADNREYGSHDEHEIGEAGNFVLLFNDDKTLFGVFHLAKYQEHLGQENDEDAENLEDNEEAIYKRTFHFFAREDKLPTSCLIVLNASEELSEQLKSYDKTAKTFDEIVSNTWSEDTNHPEKNWGYTENGTTYFTMTSSMYYDSNGTLQAPVNIEGNLFPTLPEAKEKPVKIYVERLAAKFSFIEEEKDTPHTYGLKKTGDTKEEKVLLFDGYDGEEEEGSLDPDDEEDVGILKTKDITSQCTIKVTGWGINAQETRSYLFKNTGTYDSEWSDNSYQQYHWSIDPHYDKDATSTTWRYPWQYRSAVERKTIDYYSKNDYTSPLKNYSYTQFVEQTTGSTGADDYFDRVVYTPENTYDPTLYKDSLADTYLDKRTNLLVGTHLIICAELLIDGEKKHIYRDRLGVYYETQKDCLAELVRQFNHDLKTQSIMKFHYYNWNPSTPDENDGKVFTFKSEEAFQLYEDMKNGTYERATVSYINNKQDITLSKATVLNGDGKLTPWTDGLINNWVIRKEVTNGDGSKSYTEPKIYYGNEYDENDESKNTEVQNLDAINVVKSLLYEWVGAVDHFHDGKMYYAAPIMHNAINKQEKDRNQNILGDYGVVRNHWYKITLTDILHTGTPVDEPDDPIVPNRVVTKDQIHFKVDIPNWHEIETIVPIL